MAVLPSRSSKMQQDTNQTNNRGSVENETTVLPSRSLMQQETTMNNLCTTYLGLEHVVRMTEKDVNHRLAKTAFIAIALIVCSASYFGKIPAASPLPLKLSLRSYQNNLATAPANYGPKGCRFCRRRRRHRRQSEIFAAVSSSSRRQAAITATEGTRNDEEKFFVMVSLKVKPDMHDKFLKAALIDARGSVIDEPGCYRFDIIQDELDENKFAFYEVYEDRAAFDFHTTTPHFLQFKKVTGEVLSEKERVSFCKNIYPALGGGEASICWSSVRQDDVEGSLQVIHAPHFIKNGRVNEFIEEILEDANGSLSQEPGCLRFDVLQNIEDPKEIYLYEVYTNSDAFEYHKTTPHIAKWLEATKDIIYYGGSSPSRKYYYCLQSHVGIFFLNFLYP
eukprot:jgi/Bigna1/146998/aug1.126_g21706